MALCRRRKAEFDLIQMIDFDPRTIDKTRAQALLIVPTMSHAAVGIS
jgi:hypothetical protein